MERPKSRRFLVVAGGLLVALIAAFVVYGHQWQVSTEIHAARRELASDRPADALERLERLAIRFPQEAQVQFWRAVANRRCDHLGAADTLLTQAELLGHDPAEISLQRALLNSRAGRFDEVEQVLRDAVERGVNDDTAAEIYDAMATGYVAAFRLRDAWQCLEFWKQWQPTAIRPRLLRGAISEQAGNREEAVLDYQAVLETDPTNVEARLKLGGTLLDLNRVDQALAEFRIGQQQHSDVVELSIGAASCLRRLGQLDEAQSTLDELLKQHLSKPVRAEVLRIAGEVQLELSHYDEASRFFRSAEQLMPKDPRVHYDLFRALTFLGRGAEAKAHQAIFQKLSESTQRLRRITATLIDEPNRVDLRFEAGAILSSNEFFDEAAGWWMSVLRIDPRHRPSHLALAEHYRRKGNPQLEAQHRYMANASPEVPEAGPPAESPTTRTAGRSNSSTAAKEDGDAPTPE